MEKDNISCDLVRIYLFLLKDNLSSEMEYVNIYKNIFKNQETPGKNGGSSTTFSYRVMVFNLLGIHFRI